MPTLEDAYAHCRRVARSEARNFYYSFLLLSPERRDAMCALYAFMRRADDIADNTEVSEQVRRLQLEDWRSQLRAALDGVPNCSAELAAFRDTVSRYGIPHDYFYDLLDGMESDLTFPAYRTFEELRTYCFRAASVVGMATVHVFGFESDAALGLAARCGLAFQLTNIMRDVSADAAMGRVYFPSTELEAFGLRPRDFRERSIQFADKRFQRFMTFQWERANRYYLESAELLRMVHSASRPALWAMVSIYHGLLVRIRASRFNVLDRNVRLPTWKKLWIVGRALQLRATGGMPPFRV